MVLQIFVQHSSPPSALAVVEVWDGGEPALVPASKKGRTCQALPGEKGCYQKVPSAIGMRRLHGGVAWSCMVKAEGRNCATAWSGSLGCSQVGFGGRQWSGSQQEAEFGWGKSRRELGLGRRDRAPLRFRWAVRASLPQPCPEAGLRSPVCNLACD